MLFFVVFLIRFSTDDKMIAVGSQDSSLDFFDFDSKAGKINRIGYCGSVPSSVLQIDWSVDSKYIRVNHFCLLT